MSTVGWLLLVAVGIALGFSVARLWPGSAARVTALEKERNEAREDLQNYRQEVGQHFERTAELFDKVTTDYRDLYEHLARSERQLGAIRGESASSSLAQPEQRRLGGNPAASAAAAESADTAAEAATQSAVAEEVSPSEQDEPRAEKDEPPGDEEVKRPDGEEVPSAEEVKPPGDQDASPGDETATDGADEDDASRRGQ